MMKRIGSGVLITLALLLGIAAVAAAALPSTAGYIVVLKKSVDSPSAAAAEIAQQVSGRVGYIYTHAIKGFSITVPPQAVAALENNPNVKYVATDDLRYAFAQTIPTGIQRIFADTNPGIDIDSTDDYRVDVDVAVIDTGVDFEHPDLNVVGGINCSEGNPFRARCKDGGDDDHYHGTHVAGTIGAIDNGVGVVGVAPGARLWAVKVLDSNGSGYSSWIIAGIDWVAQNADTIEVANMSLGGYGYNQAEYDAIQGAVEKGVAFAVSAGNENDDANNYSPAAFDNVLTVSALADFDGAPGYLVKYYTCREDQDDTLADFSNWGSAVDIAAPGVCIYSTFPIEHGTYGTISGTSMASPHAAGALALLASANNPSIADDVYSLYAQVIGAGNDDWFDDSYDENHEPLLDVNSFSAFLIATGDSTNYPPTVSITSPADGASFYSSDSIPFAGSATDAEDVDLTTDMVWTSNINGQIGTGGSFNVSLSVGTHTIVAEVTDSGGLPADDSIIITVVEPSSGGSIELTATSKSNRNWVIVDLSWSGANSPVVEVHRDGVLLATTSNDGSYTDKIANTGSDSATYKICESGGEACSSPISVSW